MDFLFGIGLALLLSGVGLGILLGKWLWKPKAIYEGKIIMHGTTLASSSLNTDPQKAGNAYPTSVLSVGLKHRYDGRVTIQFEGDCPARDVLHDSEVGDIWQIGLSRTRKIKPSQKRVIDWRDTDMASAFGGRKERGPLR